MLRKFIRISAWCSTACLLLAFLALILSMEGKRRFTSDLQMSSTAIRDASRFVSRESRKIVNAKKTIFLSAKEFEINDTLALVHRSYPRISGYANFESNKAFIHISVKSSVLGIGTYFNISGELHSSEHGIKWKRAKIGDLPLGQRGANWVFKRIVYIVLGKRYGREILTGVGSIKIKPNALSVRFTPPEDFQKGFAMTANRVSGFIGQNIQLDTARVQHYLDHLVLFSRKQANTPQSISIYLQSLFGEVKKQRLSLKLSAENENISAMYALAIQIAPGIFRHFVNDLKVNKLNATPIPKLTLAEREDLAKHFIYSAALKILADKGVSFSIGEAKELLDASAGGSGFSFADLTADRAGIRFAEVVGTNTDTAQLIQEIAASGIQENDIFPALSGLPEGLSEVSFEALYSGTDSQEYQAMLDEIDKRLNACALLSL